MPLFSGEDRGQYSVCDYSAAKLLFFISSYLQDLRIPHRPEAAQALYHIGPLRAVRIQEDVLLHHLPKGRRHDADRVSGALQKRKTVSAFAKTVTVFLKTLTVFRQHRLFPSRARVGARPAREAFQIFTFTFTFPLYKGVSARFSPKRPSPLLHRGG